MDVELNGICMALWVGLLVAAATMTYWCHTWAPRPGSGRSTSPSSTTGGHGISVAKPPGGYLISLPPALFSLLDSYCLIVGKPSIFLSVRRG
jgi:hypothetical protein